MATPKRSWNDYQQRNVYDCFPIYGSPGYGQQPGPLTSCNIFGNAHVGNQRLTSLQVAGQFTFPEETFVVQRWYARTDVPAQHRALFEQWANHARATFVVGSRLTWQLSLAELVERRPRYTEESRREIWDPFPIVIPERQDVSVRIDNMASNGALYEELVAPFVDRRSSEMPCVWIHFEGVMCRDGAAVAEIVQMQQTVAYGIEERVARWVIGQTTDDLEHNATLQALSDGILEGRARW